VIKLPQKTWRKPAGWCPDNRIGLVFSSSELTAIYSVPASGGKAVQLTAKWATMPSWTPDGKWIYFMGAHQEESGNIEFVPAEGGKVTRIPVRGSHPLQPGYPGGGISISPDGKKILFQGRFYAAPVERLPHMFTIPIEGGEVTELDTGMKLFSYPCWSPDGKSFAFVGHQEIAIDKRVTDIYTISASGGKAQKLTSDSDQVTSGPVAWSPDGSTIAFYSQDGKIKLLPAHGGPTRVILEGLKGRLDHSGLAWSPDGKELGYGLKGKIWKVSLEDGKNQEVQTGLDAVHEHIAWSPDGRTIAFSAWQGGEPELWLMSDFLPLLRPKR
jgi:Tol biopolymer transport system component